jgi:hypothetical protein
MTLQAIFLRSPLPRLREVHAKCVKIFRTSGANKTADLQAFKEFQPKPEPPSLQKTLARMMLPGSWRRTGRQQRQLAAEAV